VSEVPCAVNSELREGPKISREAIEFTLARKAAMEEEGARTANRHR
jgi:hypothetical protein